MQLIVDMLLHCVAAWGKIVQASSLVDKTVLRDLWFWFQGLSSFAFKSAAVRAATGSASLRCLLRSHQAFRIPQPFGDKTLLSTFQALYSRTKMHLCVVFLLRKRRTTNTTNHEGHTDFERLLRKSNTSCSSCIRSAVAFQKETPTVNMK